MEEGYSLSDILKIFPPVQGQANGMKDLLRKDLVKTFLAESKLGFNEEVGFGEYYCEYFKL